jgi:hypothetical protein
MLDRTTGNLGAYPIAAVTKFGDAMEAFLCPPALGKAHFSHLPMGNIGIRVKPSGILSVIPLA